MANETTRPRDLNAAIDELEVNATAAMAEIDRLRAERAEMLEALRDAAVALIPVQGSDAAQIAAWRRARAIIEKAEGGQR